MGKKDKVVSQPKEEAVVNTPQEDYEALYKRALADYQNLSRQSIKEKEEFLRFANERLLLEFLPVYDNLKTSLAHTGDMPSDSPWLSGVNYIIKQFAEVLRNQGIEEIETVGKNFDHNSMEAVSGSGEKVIKELRPGYLLNGKVIVAAKVELNEDKQDNLIN
jgi:molecular chaperone GrpE